MHFHCPIKLPGLPLSRRSIGDGMAIIAMFVMIASPTKAGAQGVDCGRLQQQIAQLDHGGGGNRYASAARKQSVELARTQAYAHQLGCDTGFSFFGGNPQCGALTQRIQQMQANLGQLQQAGGGGGMRNDLVARFNASCRGGQAPQQPHQRGFFESLFGGGQEEQRPAPLPELPPGGEQSVDGETSGAHGGGQAVCVRTCDGGFFPLGVSARHGSDSLTEMCSALCPGTDTAVFTRNPDSDIKTAMGINGKPYMDLDNALKFTKSVTPSCSCLPAGKTWAEALANAEDVLGSVHKGDIVVTQQKSDELSRPQLDPKTRAALLNRPSTAMGAPAEAATAAAAPDLRGGDASSTAPDGVKRNVRRVGPQL